MHDVRMEQHVSLYDVTHLESPDRHRLIVSAMRERGVTARSHQLESREATREETLCVHSPDYVDAMRRTMDASPLECRRMEAAKFSPIAYVNDRARRRARFHLGVRLRRAPRRRDTAIVC